jgi:nicotinate-nucleotide pyrophosphorylase (carboxylating)
LAATLFEDTGMRGDLTSLALVPDTAQGSADAVARTAGIVAGIPLISLVVSRVDAELVWEPALDDGAQLDRGSIVGSLRGPASSLLTAERPILNFLGRLSGIATLTRQYVDAIQGTKASIYDTRKTTPGWRRLEKYAVLCGGGKNHRLGLFDAILIKDNHLAFGRQASQPFSPAEAVIQAKEFLQLHFNYLPIVEIEADTLDQLREVLPAAPDVVLLDNMPPSQIVEAVRLRDAINPAVQLEASGGITLETVRAVAETGVERISVGALTHSATSLDFGLEWKE